MLLHQPLLYQTASTACGLHCGWPATGANVFCEQLLPPSTVKVKSAKVENKMN
jgi:hypothetical protein